MPTVHLTRNNVSTLPLQSGKTETLYMDDELSGFGLRLRTSTATGALLRSFFLQYRTDNGSQRRQTIKQRKLDVDKARAEAMKMRVQIDDGVDPAGVKEAKKAEEALKFGEAVTQYLALKERKVRASTLKNTRDYLTKDLYFGGFAKTSLAKITQSHVEKRLDAIEIASGEGAASQAQKHLSPFFKWALSRGHCSQNPLANSEARKGGKRERVLKDDELAAIWRACDKAGEFGTIIRLLALTGCRRCEIGGLRWSEVDVDAGTITLPPERTKNGRAHCLTLPPLAMEIIHSVPRMATRDHLFGHRAAGGFTDWAGAKAMLKDGCAPWVIHDVRRTLVTGMAELGIEPHYIEAVVNHTSGHKGGIAGVYNQAKYESQMKRALAIWADHVAHIVDGSEAEDNVVQMRA